MSSDDEAIDNVTNVAWPTGFVHIAHTENPDDITVPDLGPVDWCDCTVRYHIDQRANASS